MRRVASVLACVGIAVTVAGCDPVTERRYFTEGAGVDLYTADRAQQIELQNQYINFICTQAGSDCGGSWTAFVQAGMNDIDQRCDGFLTWLDARRRDREPVLAEINAVNTATHAIMTVSGATPKSLDIVTAAFGLTSSTYANWNSRLLLAVNQSTVQEVVYTSQGKFRDKIKTFPIPDQPTAIYLLRNYLRLCLPTTIEAAVNVSATLVQRDAAAAAQSTVVKAVSAPAPRVRTAFIVTDAGEALRKWLRPNGVVDRDRVRTINDFIAERRIDPAPQVTTFLNGAAFTRDREELARRLGLIH